MDIDEERAERGKLRARDGSVADKTAGFPVRPDEPAHKDTPVLGGNAVGKKPLARRGRLALGGIGVESVADIPAVNSERPRHGRLRRARANQIGAAFPSEKERERADKERFSRTRLAGKHCKPIAQFYNSIIDEREILYRQILKHYSADLRTNSILSAAHYRIFPWCIL